MSKNQNVLVLGGASWNTMAHLEQLPTGKPQTIHNALFEDGAGSTGIGKAFALKALGYDPVLQMVVGADEYGKKILLACADRKIQTFVDVDNEPTPRHFNLMDPDGQRVSIFRENGGAKPDVDIEAFETFISSADVIFLNIVASSVPLLEMVAASKAKVFVDLHDYDGTNPWHDQFLQLADIVQISDEHIGDYSKLAAHLLANGVELVAVTKGKNGAELFARGRHETIEPTACDLKDANGAGDTFSIALWHKWHAGVDLVAAGRFAAAAGAICVESFEIVPAGLSEAAIDARLTL